MLIMLVGNQLSVLHDWWDNLCKLGCSFGHYANATKTWLVTKGHLKQDAVLSFKLLLNSLQNKYISMSGSTGSRPGSTGFMVLQVPGFYRFYGFTGSMVLQVLGFYRFYGLVYVVMWQFIQQPTFHIDLIFLCFFTSYYHVEQFFSKVFNHKKQPPSGKNIS